MKPARGPQTMFFANDCCGIIVVQIQVEVIGVRKAIFVGFVCKSRHLFARSAKELF